MLSLGVVDVDAIVVVVVADVVVVAVAVADSAMLLLLLSIVTRYFFSFFFSVFSMSNLRCAVAHKLYNMNITNTHIHAGLCE